MKKMIYNYRKHFIDKPWWYITFIPLAISIIVSFFIFGVTTTALYSLSILYVIHSSIIVLVEVDEHDNTDWW